MILILHFLSLTRRLDIALGSTGEGTEQSGETDTALKMMTG
jgi:hypothetical protein